MKIEPDAWLGNIFGYPVFRASLPDAANDAPVSGEMLCAVAQDQPAFFYVKVPTTRVDQVRALTAAGFSVVDVNVTFERKPAQVQTGDSNAKVRLAKPDDHAAVLNIASSSFVYSRFHLDPQIPRELANAVKCAWINSYCQKQRGECLLVAEVAGKPAGFLAILAAAIDGEPVRVIDLIAVDKARQRSGVGRALVDWFIGDSVGCATLVRVGTQAANVPSLRFYETCGFQVAETTFVLHAHVRDGEVVR